MVTTDKRGLWRRGAREVLLLALVPALVSCVMLWPGLVRQGVLAPTDIVADDPLLGGGLPTEYRSVPTNPLLGDVVTQLIPWKLYARSELAEGRFPLWNPYNLLGTHFHASLQSQVLSPFNLLWLLLPPLWGIGAIHALKWTLCGLGMGLLLRRLGLGVAPAIFGAAALQLSSPVLGWLQWPLAEALAWVPWLLWAALRWVETLKPLWLAALSAFVVFEILAGHIETAFHSLLLLAVFALAAWLASPEVGKQRVLSIAGLAGAALLGAGLAAAQVLPFLEVLTSSFQWVVRSQVHAQAVSLPAEGALLWLTPNGFGWSTNYVGPINYIEANPFVGASTLLLAGWMLGMLIIQLRTRRGERRTMLSRIRSEVSPRKPWFWLGMFAISASMSYGIPPLSLLRELPGFSSSLNWRLISVTGLCVIVLAAMGLHHLVSLRERALSKGWTFAAGLFALAGVLFLMQGWRAWAVTSEDIGAYMAAWRAWAGALFCAGALLVLARIVGWLRPGAFGLLVVGLLLLDMMRAGWGFNHASAYHTFYPENTLTQWLSGRGPTERVAVVGRYAASNMLLPYRIADYRLYDPTISDRYMTFTRALSPETFRTAFRTQDASYTSHLFLLQPSAHQLSAAGVKWLVVAEGEDPNDWQADLPFRAFEPMIGSHGFRVWENLFARPYAYFASRWQVSPDEGTARERVRYLTLDKGNVVLIEDPRGTFPTDAASLNPGQSSQNEQVSLHSYAPGKMELNVRAEEPRFLVVNESSAAGWRAEIDGSSARLYRTNLVVQGLVVPAGEHRVALVFDPPAFRWGVGISLTSLALWLGLVGLSVWRAAYRGRRR